MIDNLSNNGSNELALLVSSCDIYEDAWNPFFRLLELNWPECPKKIYLINESKEYVDSYFQVKCIHCDHNKWSNRMIFALDQIKEKYIWFFLEDFFLEDKVDNSIACLALNSMKKDSNIGVIKFIPNITSSWYDDTHNVSDYFSLIPIKAKHRSNLMIALYERDYFVEILRKNETPWDFEKFGAYRTRRSKKDILIQNNIINLAFPYNYQIKYGYGISKKRWLKNNKLLFEKYKINVNFDNLGWYEEDKKSKVVGLKRSLKEKILMPILEPKTFYEILRIEFRQKIYYIKHIKHFF